MKIIVAIHGKPKDKRILEILEEYRMKISRYQKTDFEFLSNFETVEKLIEKLKSKNATKIYLLDEDGKEFTSLKFAENYEKDLNNGEKEVVFVIGPAEGFGELVKAGSSDENTFDDHKTALQGRKKYFLNESDQKVEIISLSKMAMQHDLASLVLVEQVYRAVSIKNNLPYHKV